MRWLAITGAMAACMAVAFATSDRLVIGSALVVAGVAAAVPVIFGRDRWPAWVPAALSAAHIAAAGLSMLEIDDCGIGWIPPGIQYVWLNYLSATRVLGPLVLALASAALVPRDGAAGLWGVIVSLLFYAYDIPTMDALFCGLPE